MNKAKGLEMLCLESLSNLPKLKKFTLICLKSIFLLFLIIGFKELIKN